MGTRSSASISNIQSPQHLSIPKFLINGTGDEFFVTDSWQFYWNKLIGENFLQYVPNGNHGLTGSYNPGSLIAFYNAIITNRNIPEFNWYVSNDSIYLDVDSNADYTIKSWQAINENTRDFRVDVIGKSWKSDEIYKTANDKYYLHVSKPTSGYKAGLLEITIDSGTNYPFVFTTGTLISPNSYPFMPFEPLTPKGKRIK